VFWTQLDVPVVANGDVLVIHDNIGPNTQRFYRSVQLD